ncbi:MAG: hypothetical protein Q9227_000399 [Pyrenula ochraceoflavens]
MDDDLVFTLSDHDILSEDSEPAPQSRKRKRGKEPPAGRPSKTRIQDSNTYDEDSEATSGIPEEDDGAMVSDFEFEPGSGAQIDVLEDFDGWDNSVRGTLAKERKPSKKAVDIDEIIERRQQQKKSLQDHGHQPQSTAAETNSGTADTVDSDSPSDHDNHDNEWQKDELMAEDGFGMGADSADEDQEHSEEDSAQRNGVLNEDVGSEDGASVASPTAHPDDDISESGSDNDREKSAEEERRQAFFAPEDSATLDLNHTTSSGKSFHDFSLSRPILKGVAAVGYARPTPIQAKTIPVALLGKDVVGGAVTGSGKTAAFIVPILERLLYRPRKVPTSRVAILMPTRELAVQCFNVATKLANFMDVTFCQLVGGFSLREQENILKKRPDVIIATPGRFIDHMRNSASFTVDTLEILVLDEADRMLEEGFADELNEILKTIPRSRQTMLFSATMTDSVDKLVRVGLNKPVRLLVDARKQTVGTLTQEFVRLRPGREDKRLAYLVLLCKNVYHDRVIVFFRQKKEAHRVRIIFGLQGLRAAELHGSMSQEQRINSVESFRSGKYSFLLATDVASRGLDIKGVETVINYEAPQTHEIYLHRVGRTARAGRAGCACTIAAEPDRKVVKAAVKAGREQGAKILSRTVDTMEADALAKSLEALEDEVKAILEEEKEEKQLAQAEMQVTRGDNLIRHEAEILARPKRTWFESEKEKKIAKKAGLAELNGVNGGKKQKKKLSNKDKKKLDDHRERVEGRLWKKGGNDGVSNAASTKKQKKVSSRHRKHR